MSFLKRVTRKVASFPWILKGYARPSYAQLGEDRILDFLFQRLGIKNPSYLDIGTNHPISGSNTYYFYSKGSRGVCIEPDPALYALIKRHRGQDTILNVGIGLDEQQEADFYIFDTHGWNTFSKEEAEYRKSNGQPYREVIKMPLKNINQIIASHFSKVPDFISIDVEGLDFEIIKTLDFSKYAPTVLVMETIRFGMTNKEEKQHHIIDYVKSKGYNVYADTYVNTIFLKNNT